jgi:mercuric ion transport protein
VVVLPLVGLGAWLVRTDLVLLSLLVASFGLIAWVFHRRRTKVSCESGTHKEGMKQ